MYFFTRAVVLAQLGQAEVAIADFDASIRLNPNNSDAWFNRSLLNEAVGRVRSATSDISEAIRLDGSNVEYYLHRAELWLKAGQFSKASSDAEEALRIAPASPDALALQRRLERRRRYDDPYYVDKARLSDAAISLAAAWFSGEVAAAGAKKFNERDDFLGNFSRRDR